MSERDISHWLAKIPSSWQYVPLKRLADVVTGTADTIDADPDGQFDFVVRSSTLKKARIYTFDCEAVITAGDGAVGEVFHHLDGKFLAHQRTYVIHNFRGIEGRFFFYYFSAFFRYMCQDGSAKTTVDSVRRWMLTDMPIAVPPREVQRRIVQFLDAELERIDAVIVEEERLVSLLIERRAAVAEELVSRADSKEIRNRGIFRHVDRKSKTGEEELLSVSHITGVTPRSEKNVTMFEAESKIGYNLVEPGELVINTMWAWMGALGVSDFEGIVSPSYDIYEFIDRGEFCPEYFDMLYRTDRYIGLMKAHSRGIWESRLRLYPDVFLSLTSPVPSLKAQQQIAHEYRVKCAETDELLLKMQSLTSLLEERKQALITAAVTGELEV